MAKPELGIGVDVSGFKRIKYDKKPMRRALVKGAAVIRKEARRLLARRAISGSGEIPGMDTGRMRKAVGVIRKGSGGGWVKVGIRTIGGSDFYPAFLYYGSKKRNLKKRGNVMEAAVANKRTEARTVIMDAFISMISVE